MLGPAAEGRIREGFKTPSVAQSGANGPKWPRVAQMAQNGPNGPKWPKWPKMAQMAQSGLQWNLQFLWITLYMPKSLAHVNNFVFFSELYC